MNAAELEAVASLLGTEVATHRPVGGGCVAAARRVELTDGRVVFTKSGAGLPAGLLGVEAGHLHWLAEPEAIAIPEVLAHSPTPDVLILEWIEPGPAGASTTERFGRGLALLHEAGAPAFGSSRDGFIGTLPQPNGPVASGRWPEFWFTRRIEPFARQAHDRGSLPPAALALVDKLGARLADLAGPPEQPARVHGDLWSGNVVVDAHGDPWLVDPAAYGGHREVDLAMLSLFGTLAPGFVAAYEDVHPLAPGWEARLRLWQLEPLLVHAILFGGGYGAQALDLLRRFT